MSTDGGSVWSQADSYYSDGYDMVHEHGSTVWTCGYKYEAPNYKGIVSVSNDGGASWTRQELYSGTSYGYVRAIAADPSDANRVVALGYQNSTYTFYHTDNGGTVWNSNTASGFSGTPYALAVNPSNGNLLAAASSGGLYSSSNAGASWTRVTTAFGGANDLLESTLTSGLLVATATDGVWLWENWTGTPVPVGTAMGYPKVQCLAETGDYIYAGTSGSAAWRSYYSTGIGEESSSVITGFSISITPNPVRGGLASVAFTLPEQQLVTLTLYDLSGRQVMVAAEGIMGSGANQVSINTSDLSAGMYFARLTSGSSTTTARMVVTR